ncbi:MAG: MBL fold metallo-hydrolase [Hylemonella sp.]
MKVKFWGVRGSIPSPGPKTVRYGGNTTCIEVRTDNNELIILDAGTGIFPLSQTLLPELPLRANLLLTHTHWDHIQGLPFYMPNFIPGNVLRLHGAFDPVAGKGVEQALTVQLQHSFFPVLEDEIRAGVEYLTLSAGQPIEIGSALVTPFQLNHPVINYGYRIECNGKSIFFTGDHEPPYNIHPPGDPLFDESQRLLQSKEQAVLDAIRGVDVLIADSSYTEQEYPQKKGWGHGTLSSSIQLARKAKAKVLYCTHHEPTRSDDELEAAFAQALADQPGTKDAVTDIRLAREGECYEF